MSKVLIVILNWNSFEMVTQCLQSLVKLDYPNYEVVVVDNGSTDDSLAKLKKIFPIIVLENQENLGFAEGNNVGIRYALAKGAAYILLLNNDTVVEADFLSLLVRAVESSERTGIAGPKIYFHNSKIIWYAGGLLNKKTGFTYHIGENKEDKAEYNVKREVDFVSGCAMLVKSEVFDQIGLLDKDYFHGHEDADLCLRAAEKGIKCLYVPEATIYHKLAVASGGRRSPFYLYYRTRNHLLFSKKRSLKPSLFWPIYLILVVKRIFGSVMLGKPKGAWATLTGVYDFYAGNWGRGNGEKFR